MLPFSGRSHAISQVSDSELRWNFFLLPVRLEGRSTSRRSKGQRESGWLSYTPSSFKLLRATLKKGFIAHWKVEKVYYYSKSSYRTSYHSPLLNLVLLVSYFAILVQLCNKIDSVNRIFYEVTTAGGLEL